MNRVMRIVRKPPLTFEKKINWRIFTFPRAYNIWSNEAERKFFKRSRNENRYEQVLIDVTFYLMSELGNPSYFESFYKISVGGFVERKRFSKDFVRSVQEQKERRLFKKKLKERKRIKVKKPKFVEYVTI